MARKKKTGQFMEASVPISAMIDVVFLLIIFFVVTASIDKDIDDEKITLASAPHGKPVSKKDPRTMTVNVRKDGTLNIATIPVLAPQLTQMLVNHGAKYGTDFPIVIRGDKDTQHGYISKVMEAVTKTRLYHVRFDASKE